MSPLRIAICSGVFSLLFACGPAELAITQGSQTVAVGAEPITLTATGGSGEYQWSLLPESGVGTLSATTGESVTFTPVESVATATTGVLTLTSAEDSATVTLTVTPRAVNGRVTHSLGPNTAGVFVALAGPDGTFTTTAIDAEGNFSFPSVPRSYDLVVVAPGAQIYTVFRGLTRLDPVLAAAGAPLAAPANIATLSGTVSGGAFSPTQPALHTTRLSLESSNLFASLPAEATTDATGAYPAMDLVWTAPATLTGTLHALQMVTDASGVPTGYPGYGTLAGVGVTNGASQTRDVVLAPVDTVTFSGTAALPTGATLTRKTVAVQPGPVALLTVLDGHTDPTLSLPLPNIAGATATVVLNVTGTFGDSVHLRTGLPLDSTGLTFPIPDAPEVIAPANGATGITLSTPFSWAPVSSGTRMVEFERRSGGLRIVLVTTDTQTTLPDLSGLGLTLPRATLFDLRVYTLFSIPDVNAFASGGHVTRTYRGVQEHTETEVSLAVTFSEFTTAP